ncbi:hypothetical protein C8R44DRAFT_867510 [Mycena epipterygia]|nr:hypothetical protein C8R44DRAFT_867510 [Mycena epipterygia]
MSLSPSPTTVTPLTSRALSRTTHYNIPDNNVPLSTAAITTTSLTIDVLQGQFTKELHTTFDALRNELITIVGSSVHKEMIMQQAILHPTLPPVHSFHELCNVSNIHVHPHRHTQLRKITQRDDLDFVCVPQAIFFEKLATNKTNLFAILCCGLGKTWLTLAVLLILASGQQLVCLIPTSGLQADTILTASQLKLKVVWYQCSDAFDTEVDIVWAPIKILARDNFQTWVKQRVNAGQIWWVVLGEIHKFITDIGYRPIFCYLISLACFGVYFLGLSGTTPPPLLPILFAQSCITMWDILRMPTCSNIALHAHHHKTHATARNTLIHRVQVKLNAKLLPAWRLGLNVCQQPCKIVISTLILGMGLNYALQLPAADSSSTTDIILGVPELKELATNPDICLHSIPSACFDDSPPSDPILIPTIETRLIIARQDPIQRLYPLDITPREQKRSALSAFTSTNAHAAPPPKNVRRVAPTHTTPQVTHVVHL